MRTLTRFVAAVVTAAAVPACSVIAAPAHADPVATTATVLKVVDGDTVDIVDDVRRRYASACWASIPRNQEARATPSAAGVCMQAEFAKSTLLGQRVAFATDPSQGMSTASPDRGLLGQGRRLGLLGRSSPCGCCPSYVYHGHPSARADEIAAAEQEAKAAGRGLWGPPCFGQTTSVPI